MGEEVLPDPPGQILRSGILQTFYLVEIVVIQAGPERFKSPTDVCIVDEPTQVLVEFTRNFDLNAKTMPVKAFTLVTRRYLGQAMCRLNGKLLNQLDPHLNLEHNNGPLPLSAWPKGGEDSRI